MSYLTDANERKEISVALTSYLADTMILYMKTHTFHWNVESTHFYSLHKLFEEQYEDHWESLDAIAERVRALGFKVPPSFATLLKEAEMKEAIGIPSERKMIEELRDCNMLLSHKAVTLAGLAEKYGDLATADMMTQRSQQLEKNAWMLNSSVTHGESL